MANRFSKLKKEIATLNAKELAVKAREMESHVFQLRMQFKTGQLASTAMMKMARKELAKLRTSLRLKQESR